MGRKSCRKQRKEQLVPQAAVATPLPPLPPGSPPSREIWDWLVHPEGNFAFDLPCVISTLCLRDGERWADWEKQHNPASVRDLTMVVLGYLAADMGGIPPTLCLSPSFQSALGRLQVLGFFPLVHCKVSAGLFRKCQGPCGMETAFQKGSGRLSGSRVQIRSDRLFHWV
ncbi:UNVERIFIED_CONTAM: hypothetical protein FKN15_043422 [Acipenser sinensis]